MAFGWLARPWLPVGCPPKPFGPLAVFKPPGPTGARCPRRLGWAGWPEPTAELGRPDAPDWLPE